MGANWLAEAFYGDFAQVFEDESLAEAELGNRICHYDLFRLRVGAETGGQLNCRSKQIVVLLDWFPGCGAHSNLKRALGIRFLVLGQFLLNLNCASYCARCRYE